MTVGSNYAHVYANIATASARLVSGLREMEALAGGNAQAMMFVAEAIGQIEMYRDRAETVLRTLQEDAQGRERQP